MNHTDKYAIIIENICSRTELGKKMLQKLMYLMERKGVQLELNYSIHFFGPYSATLDNIVHLLETNGVVKIDTSGRTHKISMGENKIEEKSINDEEEAKIQFVLDNFSNKSALELEALTTLDYVSNTLFKNNGSDTEIVEEVKKIKGSKFDEEYLKEELKVLKSYGYVI